MKPKSKAPTVLLALAAMMVGAAATLWDPPKEATATPPIALAAVAPDISKPIDAFVDWLRASGRSTEAVIDRLDSEPLEVRRALVGVALKALGSPSAVNQLRALALIEKTIPDDPSIDALAYRFAMESDREDVRKLAIAILGRDPTPACLGRILQVVKNPGPRTPVEIHAALMSLARASHPPAREEALALIGHKEPLIVMGAAAVLDSIGDPVGLKRLMKLVRQESDLDSRLQALRYMASTRRDLAVDIAIEWISNPDSPALAVSWARRILKGQE